MKSFCFHWLRAVKVLVHFTGVTGESRNIRLVLQSLCVQLAEAYCPHTQLSEVLHHLTFIIAHRTDQDWESPTFDLCPETNITQNTC